MALDCKTCFIDLLKANFQPSPRGKREGEFLSKSRKRGREKERKKREEEGRRREGSLAWFSKWILAIS